VNRSQLLSTVIFLLIALVPGSVFIVYEGQQAIITRFGKPVRKPIANAGLYFKIPFVEQARLLDVRILNWDGAPNQIPTKDKKFILVDTVARWQIQDVLRFIQTVQTEERALTRIDTSVEAATRDVISSNALVEVVRNSNDLLRRQDERLKQQEQDASDGEKAIQEVEEEVTGEIELVSAGREKLSSQIAEKARAALADLGIKLIDVQLRRVAYEKSVEAKVYDRMISERERIAEKIRSVGKGEQAKIRGKTFYDLQAIESTAYKTVQEIKAAADAQAMEVYASAIGEDLDFYELTRTLETYRRILRPETPLLLSVDTPFLRILRDGALEVAAQE
jgi:modulator of FtsH protease HflC